MACPTVLSQAAQAATARLSRATDLPPTPPTPHTLLSTPGRSTTDTLSPRKHRRRKWWEPIHRKITCQKEKRQYLEALAAEMELDSTSYPRAQDHVSRTGIVDSTQRQAQAFGPVNSVRPGLSSNRQPEASVSTSSCTAHWARHPPPPQNRLGHGHGQHGLGLYRSPPVVVPPGIVHPFVFNLRNSASHDPVRCGSQGHANVPRTPYVDYRQWGGSQSSATNVGDTAWPPMTAPPIVVTSCNGEVFSAKSRPDHAAIDHNVMGMGPPTPRIPSMDDSHIEAELASEPLQLMPDPESSNCAPRLGEIEWDSITHVADNQPQVQSRSIAVESSPPCKAVEVLFSNMKEPILTPLRAFTFPGRERCLVLPVSLFAICLFAARLLIPTRQVLRWLTGRPCRTTRLW